MPDDCQDVRRSDALERKLRGAMGARKARRALADAAGVSSNMDGEIKKAAGVLYHRPPQPQTTNPLDNSHATADTKRTSPRDW